MKPPRGKPRGILIRKAELSIAISPPSLKLRRALLTIHPRGKPRGILAKESERHGVNSVLATAAKEKKAQARNQRPEKLTFILLLLLTCVVLVVGAVALWLVPYIGFSNIHKDLPLVMAVLFALVVMFLIGGGLTLIFTIIRGKNLFFNRRIRGVVIRFLFPLLVMVGRCIGVNKDQVRRAFIAVNNQLVVAEARRVPPYKLLILLPQCLQNHECPVRITGNVENCKACGKCKIKNLVELSQKYHVSMAVATGGTLARKIVVDKRPEMIIGVACERDLTSGIQDTYPIPVYGILNKRPNGPCYDTDVDLGLVEQAMAAFLKDEAGDTEGPGPQGAERTDA